MIIFYRQVIEKLQRKLYTKGLTDKELQVICGLTEWYVNGDNNK